MSTQKCDSFKHEEWVLVIFLKQDILWECQCHQIKKNESNYMFGGDQTQRAWNW